MKAQDIRELTIEKIQDELDDAREELMRMRFQRATGELSNHNLPAKTRRKIARLMTVLNEKRAAQQTEGEA
jgi:large subunit ribosomal protein L29